MKNGFAFSARRAVYLQMVVLLVFLIGANDAHAYVDPGTASMAVQALLAALAAGAATVALFWQQVKTTLGRWFGKTAGEEKADPAE